MWVRSFTVSSCVAADRATVWAAVSTFDGVNAELAPLVRMTRPLGGDGTLRAGALGRSWVLLGGVVPIDADDLVLDAVDTGRGFRERSTLLSARAWHHDRTLTDDGAGTRITDVIAFAPRVAALGGLQAFVFEGAFRHRHARLRRRFGRR